MKVNIYNPPYINQNSQNDWLTKEDENQFLDELSAVLHKYGVGITGNNQPLYLYLLKITEEGRKCRINQDGEFNFM